MNTWYRHLTLFTIAFCSTMWADSITFTPLPSDGNISGPVGSLAGWGYSLTNNGATDWFLATNLNADSFSNGAPTLIFDFPEVAPGASVVEGYDPASGIGLYELQWDPSAPVGFVNSGDFTLSGQWYDGDPFNGGNFISDAIDTLVPYSATVTGSTSTPEPSSFFLLAVGIAAVIGLVKIWGRPACSHSIAKGNTDAS